MTSEIYFINTLYSYKNVELNKLYNFSTDDIYKIIGLCKQNGIHYDKTSYLERQITFYKFIKSIIIDNNNTNEFIQSIDVISHKVNNNVLYVDKEIRNIEITQFPNLYKYDSIEDFNVQRFVLSKFNTKTNKNDVINLFVKKSNKGYTQAFLSYNSKYKEVNSLVCILPQYIQQIIQHHKQLNQQLKDNY